MSQASSTYIPSGTNASLVIQSLNDFLKEELALPGNWPPSIFFEDLKTSPVRSKSKLAELVNEANLRPMSYLDFFESSRGYPRPDLNDFKLRVWKIFNEGSIMLYFEKLFLYLLNITEPTQYDNVLLQYAEALSRQPITQWNNIVQLIGACCYQFFAKEPELYSKLPYRKEIRGPEDMTDQELLDKLDANLSPTAYRGKISVEDSRSKLIQMYNEKN